MFQFEKDKFSIIDGYVVDGRGLMPTSRKVDTTPIWEFEEQEYENIQLFFKYFEDWFEPINTFSSGIVSGSYIMKHQIEIFIDSMYPGRNSYVSNGATILEFTRRGFHIKPLSKNSLNAQFKIGKRSMKKVFAEINKLNKLKKQK